MCIIESAYNHTQQNYKKRTNLANKNTEKIDICITLIEHHTLTDRANDDVGFKIKKNIYMQHTFQSLSSNREQKKK